jgi:isoleucyl-tRNA synthetase
LAARGAIFVETYWKLPRPTRRCWPSGRASAQVRDQVNKDIEALRTAGGVGSSLQAR